MEHKALIYDLSFRGAGDGKRPSLVFTIPTALEEIVLEQLAHQGGGAEAYSEEYIWTHTPFTLTTRDLLGHRVFGIGGVGVIERNENGLVFSITYHWPVVKEIALTVHTLMSVLQAIQNDGRGSNGSQLSSTQTRVESNGPHAHALGGFVYQPFVAWLLQHPEQRNTRITNDIVKGMREAWRSLSTPMSEDPNGLDLGQWESDCGAHIGTNGRFSLHCFGNACDLSIYPDHVYDDLSKLPRVEFSCHNVDSPQQQLTLLAGFARMCELVRKWNDTK